VVRDSAVYNGKQMTIISAALLLFFVMDPLGNLPLFPLALKHVDESRHMRIVVRELLIALVVLVGFLFTGPYLLRLLHISDPALSIAGGVILFLIAIRMVFPSPDTPLREPEQGEPFIVPLAIPYVAGPSALATEILLMSRDPGHWPQWLMALILAWTGSSIILLAASGMRRYIGQKALVAIERLMGMVLITVAVQMLLTGIGQYAMQLKR